MGEGSFVSYGIPPGHPNLQKACHLIEQQQQQRRVRAMKLAESFNQIPLKSLGNSGNFIWAESCFFILAVKKTCPCRRPI